MNIIYVNFPYMNLFNSLTSLNTVVEDDLVRDYLQTLHVLFIDNM